MPASGLVEHEALRLENVLRLHCAARHRVPRLQRRPLETLTPRRRGGRRRGAVAGRQAATCGLDPHGGCQLRWRAAPVPPDVPAGRARGVRAQHRRRAPLRRRALCRPACNRPAGAPQPGARRARAARGRGEPLAAGVGEGVARSRKAAGRVRGRLCRWRCAATRAPPSTHRRVLPRPINLIQTLALPQLASRGSRAPRAETKGGWLGPEGGGAPRGAPCHRCLPRRWHP